MSARVVNQTATSCCCGHTPEMHLGGPDLSQAELESLHMAKPGGDGGMCRAHVASGRCSCFNFCDCHLTKYDLGNPSEWLADNSVLLDRLATLAVKS